MSGDPFSTLAERSLTARGAVRRTLAEHTGGILLSICLLLTAALPLVVLRLVNPFSEEFLLQTAYTVLTSTLCYLLFLPEGDRCERLRDAAFATAEERLSALSAVVRRGRLADFCEFCHRAALREQEAAAAALRGRAESEMTPRRRARLLARAARLPLRPISPALVLCGEGQETLSDVGRKRAPRTVRGALLRPLLVLGSSLLFSSVTVLPGAALDAATAVRILSGLFGVTMAAFAGYTAGAAAARAALGTTERRILFLTSFLEEAGLDVEVTA